MDAFRRLMQVVLVSGTVAGFALFCVQSLLVVPLIEEAEHYEEAAAGAEAARAPHDAGWQPSSGVERRTYTALGTILMGLAYAALLFGGAAAVGVSLDVRRGLLVGLAGFVSVALAPALSLPPPPPGAPLADLADRQWWWVATASGTAVGLWLLVRSGASVTERALGVCCLALPHIIGAPAANEPSAVPATLARRFALLSVATAAIFWIVLGAAGGFLSQRDETRRRVQQ